MKPTLLIKREQLNNFRTEIFQCLSGGLHFHSPIEVLWVKKGTVRVLINDEWDIVKSGQLAIVQSYEAHQFLSEGSDGNYVIFFIPPRLCSEFSEIIQRKRISDPIIRDVSGIIDSLNKLANGNLNVIEELGYINILLGAYLRQSDSKESDSKEKESNFKSDLALNLIQYVNNHFTDDISVESIAEELGYNRHHVSKCFRSNFNTGIIQYVNTLRLKNAVFLLRKKDKCITECALESGFGSLRTFYRVFEEEFGCSPREYMRNL